MMSMNFAENIAAAMVEIRRPAWQAAGCRKMLLDYAREAPTVPLAEIGAAALIYAQTPTIQVPSLDVFRAGPWWRNSVAHERTIRPADAPRCQVDGHAYSLLPCRLCASEAKAHPDEEQKPATHHTDPEHLAIYERGARRARAAIKVPTNGEVR